MPRRNRRDYRAFPQPLDVTPLRNPPRIPDPPGFVRLVPESTEPAVPVKPRAQRQREAAERQAKARMSKALDWSVCLVPGCGEDLIIFGYEEYPEHLRDVEQRLPLCIDHRYIAWQQVEGQKREPSMIEAADAWLVRHRAREAAKLEAEKAQRAADLTGSIYYLRQNGLIKAGWTRDLRQRLKAYGPDVEVLAHYWATRDNETDLHRNLRPFLARGREWYHDCQGMRDHIAAVVKTRGAPTIRAEWTQPKAPPIRPRRAS